jgi:hypothetical protein
MTDFRRRDKAGLNHIAHEKVAGPLCILAVGLVAFLRFYVLGMARMTQQDFSSMLNTGIQYLPGDSCKHLYRNI